MRERAPIRIRTGRPSRVRQANSACERSVAAFRAAGKPFEEATALLNLAGILAAKGDREAAVNVLRNLQSRTEWKIPVDLRASAAALERQLLIQMVPGLPWRSLESLSYSRSVPRIRSQCPREIRDLNPAEAARIYEDLARDYAADQSPEEQAIALNELCGAQRRMGQYAEAERTGTAALKLFEDQRQDLGIAAAYHKLGDLYADWENFPKAEVAYRESISIKSGVGDLVGESISRGGLTRVYRAQHRPADAVVEARQAYKLVEGIGTRTRVLEPRAQRHDLPVEKVKRKAKR